MTRDQLDMYGRCCQYFWRLTSLLKIHGRIALISVPFQKEQFLNPKRRTVTIAHYKPKKSWQCEETGRWLRFGEVTFNMESCLQLSEDALKETVRHELAHAVVHIVHDKHGEGHDTGLGCGHGETWIRIAKLLRVKTQLYERQQQL